MTAESLLYRRATPDEILGLRVAVLRPVAAGVPLAFDGDGLPPPATWHFGAFTAGGENVGCLTLLTSRWDGAAALQLRGMAVAAGRRGGGIGGRLLAAAAADVGKHPATAGLVWWCNARAEAVAFYGRNGWGVVSEEFVIEGVGPHRRMVRRAAGEAGQQ
jgi:predicted GNAT family N-acyltransferase